MMENTLSAALNPVIVKEIDRFLEEFYEEGKSIELGRKMAVQRMTKTQARGLENLIASTPRFSEIINYIKNQTGKKRKEWISVGPELLEHLDLIEQKACVIAGSDLAARMDVKLRLARGWFRQVMANYLYHKDEKDEEGDDEPRSI